MALPRTMPAAARTALTAHLAEHGLELGPVKPGHRVTHTLTHGEAAWEVTYMGQCYGDPAWRLTGPGAEHGLWLDTPELGPAITGQRAARPDWTTMGAAAFGKRQEPQQTALFPEPDGAGTIDLLQVEE
jgi:hypothetical protein